MHVSEVPNRLKLYTLPKASDWNLKFMLRNLLLQGTIACFRCNMWVFRWRIFLSEFFTLSKGVTYFLGRTWKTQDFLAFFLGNWIQLFLRVSIWWKLTNQRLSFEVASNLPLFFLPSTRPNTKALILPGFWGWGILGVEIWGLPDSKWFFRSFITWRMPILPPQQLGPRRIFPKCRHRPAEDFYRLFCRLNLSSKKKTVKNAVSC